MRTTILTLVVLVFFPIITCAQANYVGYKYDGVVPETTLSNGVKHLGGGLIGDIDADPVYGISQVEIGKLKMIWLEASTGRDASGITGWKVHDVLSFPALSKTEYLFFVGDPAISCRRGAEDISNLVGVGQILPQRGIFRPSRLWIANLTTQKFERVRLTGVKCEYSEP